VGGNGAAALVPRVLIAPGRLPMGEGTDEGDRVARLIESQRTFYDLRAPDFGDEAVPDRRVSGMMASELARALVDEFAPTGDVLELACGSGSFTRELVRHARTVTAVDGSPRMLERNRRVAFVDEDDRGTTNDDIHLVDDVPAAPRTLRDGRTFDVVKVYWDPTELRDRLSSLGWQVAVRRVGESFLYGAGT
jgi:SAM-dependent methyltransferase